MAAVAAVNNMGACAHNPRGNLWFNDESTFGHKLLMKMGWSKGKGLGKNEDGIKENLKVKFRSTNSGLGYKDDPYANIMKTEYESILKSLNASYPQKENKKEGKDKEENKSDGKASRVIKSKLRYPKLFYGKDVTKYSEKDMKSIFICSLPSKEKQDLLEDSADSVKQESEFPKENKTYSSTLSISDYFTMKMNEKQKNCSSKENINEITHQKSSLDAENNKTWNSSAQRSKLEFKEKGKNFEISDDKEPVKDSELKLNKSFEIDTTTDKFATSRKKQSKKKRKVSETSFNEIDSVHDCAVSKKKKQKLSKDCVSENVSKTEITEAERTFSIDSCIHDKKRKKCKRCRYEDISDETPPNDAAPGKISCQIELSSEKVSELKKKYEKDHNKNKNLTVNANDFFKNSQLVNDKFPSESEDELVSKDINSSKKIKKLKKMKKLKHLKSCLKNKTGSYSIKNVSFNENVSYRVIDTDYESVECLADECNISLDDLMNEKDFTTDDVKNVFEANILDAPLNSDNDRCNNESKTEIEERPVDEIKSGCFESNSLSAESSDAKIEDMSTDGIKDDYLLSSLPSSKSSHYNSWVESQRQALKMQMYKKMLKSIKKHKVLKTSNLLFIKGYGNWGFK